MEHLANYNEQESHDSFKGMRCVVIDLYRPYSSCSFFFFLIKIWT